MNDSSEPRIDTGHERRMDLQEQLPDFYAAVLRMEKESRRHLDPVIAELVKVRISQINGCAFCLDMHTTDARRAGEEEYRLHVLPAWREAPFFTARERAALAVAERMARISEGGVPDEEYEAAAKLFGEQELAALLAVCVTINAWNRIAVSTRLAPPARD
ncbi:carboxymuconolactone decarboxylase family protein [Phaeacidiphilus oryzae]|uniref:carboxymuconolactone decarboxylase family protein n=1 Tax=Phaeacidiphilus oryzae TaxID=348818 RepID=UPI000691CCA1|nr:carboxymuconolactone decarboxylase family protein [Phaeacidiphilus oryzae]